MQTRARTSRLRLSVDSCGVEHAGGGEKHDQDDDAQAAGVTGRYGATWGDSAQTAFRQNAPGFSVRQSVGMPKGSASHMPRCLPLQKACRINTPI